MGIWEHFVHPDQSSIVELVIRSCPPVCRRRSCQAIAEHDIGVMGQWIQYSAIETGRPFHDPFSRRAKRCDGIVRWTYKKSHEQPRCLVLNVKQYFATLLNRQAGENLVAHLKLI